MRLPRAAFASRGFRTVRSPYFLCKVKKNDLASARIGVVVGKAVTKSSPRRNSWKRTARAVLEAKQFKGTDLILTVLPPADKLTKKKFREEVTKIVGS